MDEPRFSVLVPAYRGAATIRRAVTSALSQTDPPLDVVVCDDGSPDDIAGALAGLPVQLVRQENRGVNAARNTAARRARGEWLVLLDQDDEWLPGRLAAIRGAIESGASSLGLVTTDAWVVDPDGTRHPYYRSPFPPPQEQRRQILQRNFVFASAAIHRDVWQRIGGFNEETGSEYEAWLRAILDGSVAAFVNRPLALYYRSQMQKSRDWIWTHRGVKAALEWAIREGDLDAAEEAAARTRLQAVGGRLALALAVNGLRDSAPDRRQRALRAARSRTLNPGLRMKLVAAAAAPSIAARRLPARSGWYG